MVQNGPELWQQGGMMDEAPVHRRSAHQALRPPLDPDTLPALAVRYLERYQTSRARLRRYLDRKLRQRGWAGRTPPDLEALLDAMVARGYVDDGAFADARVRALSRRGYGQARVRAELAAAGIDAEAGMAALDGLDPLAAALAFARRRRLGPYGPPPPDRAARDRQIAQLLRAGHPPGLARAIVEARREADLPDDVSA